MKKLMNFSWVVAILVSTTLLFTAFTPSSTLDAPQKMDVADNLEDGTLGEIVMFAGNYEPRGWAFCEGQILSASSNSGLFSILGTMYGGDGRTTFGLPNLKEAEKNLGGVRYIICISGRYPTRN